MASSTVIPPSSSDFASGVSGDRSVSELFFVKMLLRSVPLAKSMLDAEVIAEFRLERKVSGLRKSEALVNGNRAEAR